MWWFASYWSSFTPMTKVPSMFLPGAEDNLLSASLDVCLCLAAFGEKKTGGLRTRQRPGPSRRFWDHAQGSCSLPSTTSAPFLDLNLCVEATHDGVVPSRCAGVSASVRSLIATISKPTPSVTGCAEEGAADAAKPLITLRGWSLGISLSVRWWRCTNPMPWRALV